MKIDGKSLKLRLWGSFALFTILILAMIWGMQILLFRTYYEEMKTREVVRMADDIVEGYAQLDLWRMISYSRSDDVFIRLETETGLVLYTPGAENQRPTVFVENWDLSEARAALQAGETSYRSITSHVEGSTMLDRGLIYGRRIEISPHEDRYAMLFICAPLAPAESTMQILTQMLVYVSIMSVIISLLISFFLAKRITGPLVDLTASARRLADGETGVSFDVGDRRYTEINELADTLDHASQELAKTEELQKDLIANVSHDIRTPLTMVRSYAEMVRDLSGDDPEKRNAHLGVIIDEADRMDALVQDMLTLSRMQSGAVELELRDFSLTQTASDMVEHCRPLGAQDGALISLEAQGDCRAHGDEPRIRQVLTNLISNALRYAAGAPVTVRVEERQEGIYCAVEDRGPGIPEEDLEQIWKRYYRSSANLSRGEGTGLGLAITREILDLHKSRFGVRSRLGEGSTFWFMLDKAKEEPHEDQHQRA